MGVRFGPGTDRTDNAMKPSAQTAQMNQEAALLDYVARLQKHKSGRRAVHIRLSNLRPYNRREHHVRIATSSFDRLVDDFEGGIFQLFNDDLVVICNGATIADMDKVILHLRYLFSDDPLLKDDEEGRKPFCDWFDLKNDYPKLYKRAEWLVKERERHDAQAVEEALSGQTTEEEPLPSEPLDPANLGIIEAAIAQADLSTMIRQQPICAMTADRKPVAAYSEIFTSIEALRRTLLPNINIYANRWLFQDLTQHLDMRVLAHLTRLDSSALPQAFSLNLNVSTLISPQFLNFDETLSKRRRSGVVIELQLIDIYSDLGNYLFARDFLHQRGYKVCLDGTPHLSLPLVNREDLGVDLVKLFWSADMAEQLNGPHGEALREAVSRLGAGRLILARCDSEQALEFGLSLGITLYQGYLLDTMLSKDRTRTASARTMSDALARQRTANRR